MNELKTAIERAEVISFDIFDTLLIRPYSKPTDLFSHLEEIHGMPGFKQERIRAELKKRKEVIEAALRDEITYDEIYDEMDARYAFLKQHEAELEIECCMVNQEIHSAYDIAVSAGKKIVFSSDMYLPKEVIEKMLHKNGYAKYDNLYLSCADFISKANKSTYLRIIKDNPNVNKSNIIHIGDNYHTDYQNAISSGIRAFWYQRPIDRYLEKSGLSDDYKNKMYHSDNALISLFLGTSALYRKDNPNKGYWQNFAFQNAWLPLFSFTVWLKEEIKKAGIKNVFFLARDGLIIKKLFDIINDDDSIKTQYVFASRRCFRFPLIRRFGERELNWFLQGMEEASAQDFWDAFHIDNKYLERKFLQAFKSHRVNDLYHAKTLLKGFFDEFGYEFLKETRKEKEVLIDYLQTINLLNNDPESKDAIVDIGWIGSMQQSIADLKEEYDFKNDISGYYFSVRPECMVDEGNTIKGFYIDKACSDDDLSFIKCGVDILEFIFAAPHNGIVKLAKNIEGSFSAIYQKDSKNEEFRKEIAEIMQNEIISFTAFFIKLTQKFRYRPERKSAILPIKTLIESPRKMDLDNFSEIKVSANMGGGKDYPISPSRMSLLDLCTKDRRALLRKIHPAHWKLDKIPQGYYGKLATMLLKHKFRTEISF